MPPFVCPNFGCLHYSTSRFSYISNDRNGKKVRYIIKSVFVSQRQPNILSQQWKTRLDYSKKSRELTRIKTWELFKWKNINMKEGGAREQLKLLFCSKLFLWCSKYLHCQIWFLQNHYTIIQAQSSLTYSYRTQTVRVKVLLSPRLN